MNTSRMHINDNTGRRISPAIAAAIATSLLFGGMAKATSFGAGPNYKTNDPQLKVSDITVRPISHWENNGNDNDQNQTSNMAEAASTPTGDISMNVNHQLYHGMASFHHERTAHGLEYLKSDPATLYTQDRQHSAKVSLEVTRKDIGDDGKMHQITPETDSFNVRGGSVVLEQGATTSSASGAGGEITNSSTTSNEGHDHT